MKTLTFRADIKAPAKKVYKTMLGIDNKNTYEQWTAEFNPVSTYEGSWDKGSKILFVGVDEDGNRGGMVSEIAENTPYSFVSIRHKGMLEGNKEILEGEKVNAWSGSLENYRFVEKDGITTVTVDLDVAEDYIDYFNTAWPKALKKLKQISEK